MELPSFKIVLIALGVVGVVLLIELVILFKKSPQSIPIVGRKLVPQIEVLSELKDFSVELVDEKKLSEYIDKFGLFKNEGIKIRGTTGYQTAKNLVIRFVAKSEPDFFDEHMSKEGEVYAASRAWLSDDKLNLTVFIKPTLYGEKGANDFSRYFSTMTVRGLFLSSRLYQEMAETDKKAGLENLYGEGSGLFFIAKKE